MKNIFPIIVIVIAIGFVLIYVQPRFMQVQELKLQRDDLSMALESATELKRQGDYLRDVYGRLSRDTLDRLDKFLPSNIDNVKLILEIEQIAKQRGLSLTNVTVGEDEDSSDAEDVVRDGQHGTVTMGFTMIGEYDHFIDFLDQIEKNLRLIDIDTLTFSEVPPTGFGVSGPPKYIFNLDMKTYWLQEVL